LTKVSPHDILKSSKGDIPQKKGNFKMEITGRFEADSNFITVYTEDKVFTLAFGGGWGSVDVPGYSAYYAPLTKEWLAAAAAECTETGTFRVDENGWKRLK
jgi:hypothetical protein